MDTKIFLSILLLSCCHCMVVRAQMSDCCLTVKNKPIPASRVVDYHHQIKGQGCSIDATILVTRHGRKLCVPLNENWVSLVKTQVIQLKTHCQEVNYKGKRCFGVKRQ
ncbi:C-C motif chemokine 19-like [Salarias fasciatus]|uniref:C-C motif chemokine 19-like n=1 Tax=Salarias fasciatus TaxID=181472 RepID=A0A672HI60_SALFA|nr:C-C motif chemokine 19-like [Salarias fasciatus]